MLIVCMESEHGLEGSLRMPSKMRCGQQPPHLMANGGSSVPLLHRVAVTLQRKMMESCLDTGDAGTTEIPEREHPVL